MHEHGMPSVNAHLFFFFPFFFLAKLFDRDAPCLPLTKYEIEDEKSA
jgi:hypothetical protein